MIILNEFNRTGWSKRRYANEELDDTVQYTRILQQQLEKADIICAVMEENDCVCPYMVAP